MSRVTLTNVYERAAKIPGLAEVAADGAAKHLELWQQAMEAARKDSEKQGEEEQGVWDLLFEKRAEMHKEAIALSEEAQEARLEMKLRLNATAAVSAYSSMEQ